MCGCVREQHCAHTLSASSRKMPGTIPPISMEIIKTEVAAPSFPSVAHHISSASGQAAAGVGQRADATLRFPWQQRRGSETRNVANTPSSCCSPAHRTAKYRDVLGGRGGRKSPSVSTFQVAEFPKIKRNDNFPSQSGAEGKETRHAGLVFCVRNACVL